MHASSFQEKNKKGISISIRLSYTSVPKYQAVVVGNTTDVGPSERARQRERERDKKRPKTCAIGLVYIRLFVCWGRQAVSAGVNGIFNWDKPSWSNRRRHKKTRKCAIQSESEHLWAKYSTAITISERERSVETTSQSIIIINIIWLSIFFFY